MLHYLIVILTFLSIACTEKTRIQEIGENPKEDDQEVLKLNQINQTSDSENVVLGQLRSTRVGERTINISAERSYFPDDSKDFFYNFPSLSYAELPQNIPTSKGMSGKGWIRLDFKNEDNDKIVCTYKGEGTTDSSAPSCNNNGYYYSFQYCVTEKHFRKKSCNRNIDKKECRDANLSYAPYQKVPAHYMGVTVEAGDSCSTTEVQFTMAYLNYNPNNQVSCGDILTGDFTLQHDLDCTGYPGYALAFTGDNVDIDGNGFKIIAPNGAMAIMALGDKQDIHDFVIEGNISGIGIFAHDTDKIEIYNNEISNVNVGIHIMTENVEITNIEVEDNIASGLGEFGLYINSYSLSSVYAKKAKVKNNDFSNTGDYAIHMSIQKFDVDQHFDNNISGSQDGIYLAQGKFEVKKIDFLDVVRDTTLFFYNAEEVKIDDVLITGHNGNADESEAAIHIYRCDKVEIEDVEILNKDIGIKLATSAGVESEIEIEDSEIVDNIAVGIMIQSYDGTAFKKIEIKDNDLGGNPTGRGIWEVDNVSILQKSFQNNQF